MSNEDYREKVEEHRQEIDLHNDELTKVSRVKRHRKPGTKKRKNPIMTSLVVFFILLPLSMLGYVWLFYEPEAKATDKEVVKEETNEVVIQKNDPEKTPVVDLDESKENDEGKKQEEDVAKVEQEKERLAAEEAKKAEQKKAADKLAAAQKEQEEKKKAEQQAKAKAKAKTHTVSSTDNLYQIAIKYYGNGSTANIEKIKSANNLSSDSISAGQVLVITP